MKNRFYAAAWSLLRPLLLFLFPLRVHGAEQLPKDRPVVLCPNHSHALDPVLVAMSLPREYPLRMMAKKQLFSIPLLGGLIRLLGAFPVDRGHSDIGAVKQSIAGLRDGYTLLIFPEGTRMKNGQRGEAKSGAAMIAIRSGVALVPVYIGIGRRLFHRTHLVFGEPFMPEYTGRKGTAEEYQANADEVLRRAYALEETL